jgi:hypothetical protein
MSLNMKSSCRDMSKYYIVNGLKHDKPWQGCSIFVAENDRPLQMSTRCDHDASWSQLRVRGDPCVGERILDTRNGECTVSQGSATTVFKAMASLGDVGALAGKRE